MTRRDKRDLKQGRSLRRLLRNVELQQRDWERKMKDSIQWRYGCPNPIIPTVELREYKE